MTLFASPESHAHTIEHTSAQDANPWAVCIVFSPLAAQIAVPPAESCLSNPVDDSHTSTGPICDPTDRKGPGRDRCSPLRSTLSQR